MQKISILFFTVLASQVLASIPATGFECSSASYVTENSSSKNIFKKLWWGKKIGWYTIEATRLCAYETYDDWKLTLDSPDATFFSYDYSPYSGSYCTTGGTLYTDQTSDEWHEVSDSICGYLIALYNNAAVSHTFEQIFKSASSLVVTGAISLIGISMYLY